MQLEIIKRENFNRLLAKRQIHQYFPHQNFVLYGKLESLMTRKQP